MSGPRALAAVALGLAAVAPAGADEIRTVPTRPGVTQSFLLVRPSGPPRASVVLFAGGHGALRLGRGRLGWAVTS